MAKNFVQHNIHSPEGFAYAVSLIKDTSSGEKEYDVSNFVSEINVWESLFAKSMQCLIGFVDGAGLVEHIALEPGDQIEITIVKDQNDVKINKRFYILSIDQGNRVTNSQGRTYTIGAVTKAAHMNKLANVIRSYKGTLGESLQSIARDYLSINDVDIEPTSGYRTVCMTGLSPFNIFDWISKQALSANGRTDSLYYFYETADGFKFKTLRKIVEEANTHNYTLTVDKNKQHNEKDIYSIMDFHQNQLGSQHSRIDGGLYQNELMQFDIINREIKSKKYKYSDDYDKIHVIGKNPVTDLQVNYPKWINPETKNKGTTASLRIRSDETAFGQTNTLEQKYNHTLAQGALFNQISLSMSFFGNPKIRSGDLIDIEAGDLSAKEQKELDFLLNGKFLIANVRHRIVNAEQYVTHIDVFKDGFDTPYEMKK